MPRLHPHYEEDATFKEINQEEVRTIQQLNRIGAYEQAKHHEQMLAEAWAMTYDCHPSDYPYGRTPAKKQVISELKSKGLAYPEKWQVKAYSALKERTPEREPKFRPVVALEEGDPRDPFSDPLAPVDWAAFEARVERELQAEDQHHQRLLGAP